MRLLRNGQAEMDFVRPTTLRVVEEYRRKYEEIGRILDENPKILMALHRDLAGRLSESRNGRKSTYTSEQVLRSLIVMFVEDLSYRDAVVQIENSEFLRKFVRLGVQPMMDFTFLSRAFGVIREETWEKVNRLLAEYAKQEKKISGEKLRIDTTAYETNIHYPTDSSLLWDGFRTLARLLRQIKREHPRLSGRYRFHDKKVKKSMLFVARNGKSQKKSVKRRIKTTYGKLVEQVERVLGIAREVCGLVPWDDPTRTELLHFIPLVERVVEQTIRRVFEEEKVPAKEKIYSLFEEHTELLIRGKARKEIEFGHMVLIGQTKEKFITQYEAMPERIADKAWVDSVLASHKGLFGKPPKVFTTDKGFYESMKKIARLEKVIETVSICKKGRRNRTEEEREHGVAFQAAQRFRAGVEGTISVLKRVFKMFRCLFKGFKNYASSVGCAVFSHNLVLLART
jgi:IS5 family transposase